MWKQALLRGGGVGDGKAGKGFLDSEKEFTVCTLYPRDFMYP